MEEKGIKNLKEVIALGLALGQGVAQSMEDGEWSLSDVANVWPALTAVIPAIEGIAEVPAELKDLTDDEHKELVAFVEDTFDIPQDKIEEYVELGFSAGLKIAQLAMQFVNK